MKRQKRARAFCSVFRVLNVTALARRVSNNQSQGLPFPPSDGLVEILNDIELGKLWAQAGREEIEITRKEEEEA